MAYNDSDIRPQTVALDALIRDTLVRAQGPGSPCTANALLFLGSGHRGFPAAVVRDGVLYIGSADGHLYALASR